MRVAALPALLAALAQATGDLALLRDDLRPEPDRLREPQGGLTPEQRRAARGRSRRRRCAACATARSAPIR